MTETFWTLQNPLEEQILVLKNQFEREKARLRNIKHQFRGGVCGVSLWTNFLVD